MVCPCTACGHSRALGLLLMLCGERLNTYQHTSVRLCGETLFCFPRLPQSMGSLRRDVVSCDGPRAEPPHNSQASHPAGASEFVRGERLTSDVIVGQGEELTANGRRQEDQFRSCNGADVTRRHSRPCWHLTRPKAKYHNGVHVLVHTVQARMTCCLYLDFKQQP